MLCAVLVSIMCDCLLLLRRSTTSLVVPGVPFLFLELLLATSRVELSTCAAGVGCLSHFAVLDSPVLKGTVVVRLADRVGRLLGECDAREPE
jgi:hypothetical protein